MKMNVLSKLGGIALILSTALFMTACGNADNALEEIINGSGSSEGGLTPEELATKYQFSITDLNAADITASITSVTLTDQDGEVLATATLNAGKYIVEKTALASATTVWVEAKTTTATYIQKLTAADLPTLEANKKLAMATIGDLVAADGKFYADGTAVDAATPETHAVGVIAYLGKDQWSENGVTLRDNTTTLHSHGLVLSLKNAATDAKWGPLSNPQYEFGADKKVYEDDDLRRTTDVSGYSNTQFLAKKEDANTANPAAYAAWNYGEQVGLTNTTEWFLPSAQQWVKIIKVLCKVDEEANCFPSETVHSFNNADNSGVINLENALKKAGDGNYDGMLIALNAADVAYWSSSEYNYESDGSNSLACELSISERNENSVRLGVIDFRWSGLHKDVTCHVRPIFAF